MGKRKGKEDAFLRKKQGKKQKSVAMMISGDGKRTVFSVKLKLERESFE